MISTPASPSTLLSTVSAATTCSRPSATLLVSPRGICVLLCRLTAVMAYMEAWFVNLDQVNQYARRCHIAVEPLADRREGCRAARCVSRDVVCLCQPWPDWLGH